MRSILATAALASFAAFGLTQNQGIQLVAGVDGARRGAVRRGDGAADRP